MMAMIKLWRSEPLRRLGWRLLLQIHDEVILEGPVGNREEVTEMRSALVLLYQVSAGDEGGDAMHGAAI